jgi:hypothetical protein
VSQGLSFVDCTQPAFGKRGCTEASARDGACDCPNRIGDTAAIDGSADRILRGLRAQPIVECCLKRMHDVARRLETGRIAARDRLERTREFLGRLRFNSIEGGLERVRDILKQISDREIQNGTPFGTAWIGVCDR